MGCKTKMNRRNSHSDDNVTDNDTNTSPSISQTQVNSESSVNITPATPTTDNVHNSQGMTDSDGALVHSATDPNFHQPRPHSAHHHRVIGQLLRVMGDSYCYSCGIALRQMGDQLSGEYEVRRALSTGDLPNSVKNS